VALWWLLAMTVGAADPPAVVEQLSQGRIDWTAERLITTAGSDRKVGAWKDRRVQEQDALDALRPQLQALAADVCLTPDLRARDMLSGNDEVGARLREGLLGWTIDEARYHSAGSVELEASLDLRTWLRPALVALATVPKVALPPEGPSGLVVDARGTPFEACLVPVLQAQDGRVLLQAGLMSADAVSVAPPVLFVSDPADPRAAARAGARPLFARASSASGSVLQLAAGPASVDPSLATIVAAGRVVIIMGEP
jgi:hypothetical protein